jgi:glucuronoarabinoxylan endo-1,4-beta-xylanase
VRGAQESTNETPLNFNLRQNYPNPFNPTTTISYQLPAVSFVSLKVFNVLGQEVATLVDESRQAGTHKVQWDALGMPSGMYLYRLQAGTFLQTRKLVILR